MSKIKVIMFPCQKSPLKVKAITVDLKLPYDIFEKLQGYTYETVMIDIDDALEELDKFKNYLKQVKELYKNQFKETHEN